MDLKAVRGFEGIKEAELDLGGELGPVKVAAAHGLKAARKVAEAVSRGEADYAFIEVMACPGGCLGGGGQPRAKKSYQGSRSSRSEALYAIDRERSIRRSHENPQIQRMYEDFLGEPLSSKSHHLLHTDYRDRHLSIHHSMKDIWRELKERT